MPKHPTLSRVNFTKWKSLNNIYETPENYKHPGIYLIALSEDDLSGRVAKARDEYVVYIGMSTRSMRMRIRTFFKSVQQGKKLKLIRENNLVKIAKPKNFYIAIHVPLGVKATTFEKKDRHLTAEQIKLLGQIQDLEKYAFASHVRKNDDMPRLNKNIRG